VQHHDRNIIRVAGIDREFHRLKILAVLLLPLGMSLMAVSSVNVALPTIEAGLGASASDLQWILSGYALAFGISLIPAGRAGDVMGRGSWFVLGLVLFVAASLWSGLAATPVEVNIARVFQGLGAGIFNPQIVGMIQQYFTGGGRARAFALFGLVISASVAIGPTLAGAIIAAVGPEDGWRWAFFIYIPVGLVALVLALVWFPFQTERKLLAAFVARRRGEPSVQFPRVDLDPVGAVLVALTVLCVMFPFMGRGNPLIWLLLPMAVPCGWLWLRWTRFYRSRGGEPMIDLDLFRLASFSYGTAISATQFLGGTSTFVVLALMLQNGLGASALDTGIVGLPNALVSAYASMWAGRRAISRGRHLVILGLGLMVSGSLLSVGIALLVFNHGVSYWWLALPLMFNGFGMGTLGSANQTLAMHEVPRDSGGTAGGVKQTFERVATAIGNAVITGVFFAVVAGAGWLTGFAVAFSVIAGLQLLALVLGLFDLRHHRWARGISF
jgi:MFS family permease